MIWRRGQGAIAIDLGSSSVKLIQLSESRQAYRLEKFGVMPLNPEWVAEEGIVNVQAVGETVKTLLQAHGVVKAPVILSMSGQAVIVRRVTMPEMSEDELEQAIPLEAAQHIPFNLDEVELDYYAIGPQPDGMGVMLVAVKKERLNEYLTLMTGLGLSPVVMDVDVFAMENAYALNYESAPDDVVALLNLGASHLNINILHDGTSVFTHSIALGGNRYTEEIQRVLHVPYDEAERIKCGATMEEAARQSVEEAISALNGEVASAILRSFEFFRGTTALEDIHLALLGGGAAKTQGLTTVLSDRLGLPVQIIDPFRRVEIDPKAFDLDQVHDLGPAVAVGVGLAMRRDGDR